MEKLVQFKENFETWGSGYVIAEGKYKGYRLETKVVMERVYQLDEVDDVGLPRFKCSYHTAIRVLPPEVRVKND